jgi:hypothetical protein
MTQPSEQSPSAEEAALQAVLDAALRPTAEETVTDWMRAVYIPPTGDPDDPEYIVAREQGEGLLRWQIASAYGLINGESEVGEEDAARVENRLRVLARLAVDPVDPVDRARAGEAAYDFAHVLWSQAHRDNKEYDEAVLTH